MTMQSDVTSRAANPDNHGKNADAELVDQLSEAAKLYLRHVENGESIRSLARELGLHASTVMRRIRRFEARRDDPLVDNALTRAGAMATKHPELQAGLAAAEAARTSQRQTIQQKRILRRLAESGAEMVVAPDMDKAIIIRDEIRTAILNRSLAEQFALSGWVAMTESGRLRRYAITPEGRETLRTWLRNRDKAPDAASTDEDHGPKAAAQHRIIEARTIIDPESGKRRRARINIAESPLLVLARRREKDGEPFLSPDLVQAGERLREDFELAQLGPRTTQNWDRFLTAGVHSGRSWTPGTGGAESARDRVALALRELGPGMGDVVLRVCCYLEGIEMTERRLGWSARSGKIVLRLALMRLQRHYTETYGPGSPLIG